MPINTITVISSTIVKPPDRRSAALFNAAPGYAATRLLAAVGRVRGNGRRRVTVGGFRIEDVAGLAKAFADTVFGWISMALSGTAIAKSVAAEFAAENL
jgi:hypothetical protein